MGEGTLKALGLVLFAMGTLGVTDNLVPLISPGFGLAQFHLLRSGIALAVIATLMVWMGGGFAPLRPGWATLRSILVSLSMVIYFACLALMPIAQAAAGLFTAPIFVLLGEAVFFGRPVSRSRAAAVALGFLGILLVTGPTGPFTALSLLPVLAGACYGFGNLVTRRKLAGERPLTLLAGFFLAMVVWGSAGLAALTVFAPPVPLGDAGWVLRGWQAPSSVFWAVLAAQVVASCLALGCLIRAYQIAEASLVAVFENAFLVFATGFALLFWGQVPDAAALAGLVLIALGGTLAARSGPAVRGAPA